MISLSAVNRVYERLSTLLDNRTLLAQLTQLLVEQFSSPRAVTLILDIPGEALEYGAVAPLLSDIHTQTVLEMLLIPTAKAHDALITTLKRGDMVTITREALAPTPFAALQTANPEQEWLFAPLHFQTQWLGVAALALVSPLSDEDRETLKAMLNAAASLLHNGNRYMQLRAESEKALSEMQTFQQIDAELNDTIDLTHVFGMILDWALRFTRADAAILGIYDEVSDTLEVMSQYGYIPDQVMVGRTLQREAGVTLRVARHGKAEMVPDVTMDKDYYPTSPTIRSMIAVPIFREERVVAVIALESAKLNGFTEEHLNFTLKLASRAGVSVQNARLFSETQREKDKLALILRHIADVVMVLDDEQRVILLNHSALQVFGLDNQRSYVGERLPVIVPESPLLPWLNTFGTSSHPKDPSLRLTNGRVYNVIVTEHPDIGRTMVLQDVTYFKEMDQLKRELITTVTHDLKQPLSIMRGYLDLLSMVDSSDDRIKRYIVSLEHAFSMMRQLIEDLLDMARIEEGIQLSRKPLTVNDIVKNCLMNFTHVIDQRHLRVDIDLPALPLIEGDAARLTQVFQNLIGNAIKYTPPDGQVHIRGEAADAVVMIHIQDSGIGISAEDQQHIFERFFRVRNTQTAKIEGTGLGLAIVQSLVQAHGGTIRVVSERDEGSTFTVSLPIYKTQTTQEA